MKKTKQVLLVDDHPMIREGLKHLIERENEFSVSGEADTAEEALVLLKKKLPDIAIVDISLGATSGLDLIGEIRRIYATLPILALSMHEETQLAERVIKAGAQGYIMKQEATEGLLVFLGNVVVF